VKDENKDKYLRNKRLRKGIRALLAGLSLALASKKPLTYLHIKKLLFVYKKEKNKNKAE